MIAISRGTAVRRCYSPFLAIIFSALSFWYMYCTSMEHLLVPHALIVLVFDQQPCF